MARYAAPVRFRLVPVDDKFFDLFKQAAGNVHDCAQSLSNLVDTLPNVEGHESVKACERRGDDLTAEILKRLHSSFVTPFDREDIHALAEELDDVVDDMLDVSRRLQVNGITSALPELKQQASLLVAMATENMALIDRLESMKDVAAHLEAIDRLETEGDEIYRQTLARLFGGELDALEVLRWKDIVEAMELALNTIEDISNIVEAIVLKHA
jgi:uncharacterized protein